MNNPDVEKAKKQLMEEQKKGEEFLIKEEQKKEVVEVLEKLSEEKDKEMKAPARDIICMDIETVPLDNAAEFAPVKFTEKFDARKHATIAKNWKPETKQQKIKEAAAAFPAKQKADLEYWIKTQASFKAHTCQVVLIGVLINGKELFQPSQRKMSEEELIRWWWEKVYLEYIAVRKGILVTTGGEHFDMPILFRRGKKYGIHTSYDPSDRWGNDFHKDLIREYAEPNAFGSQNDRISADLIYRFLGLPGKTGDGSMVWEWWKNDPGTLFAYNENELRQMFEAACIWLNLIKTKEKEDARDNKSTGGNEPRQSTQNNK